MGGIDLRYSMVGIGLTQLEIREIGKVGIIMVDISKRNILIEGEKA